MMTQSNKSRLGYSLACWALSGALCASAASLFMQEENIACRNGNAQLKKQVKYLLDENFQKDSGRWETFTNFEDILVGTFGGEHLGTKGFLITHGPKKSGDTAFELTSKPFAVEGGSEFVLTIAGRSSVEMRASTGCGGLYHTEIKWLDKTGKALSPTPFKYELMENGLTGQTLFGKVPADAAQAVIRIGADNPNIAGNQYVVYTKVAFRSEENGSAFSRTGNFVSKAWKMSDVGQGVLSWDAAVPAGTSIGFQVSTAPDDKGIPGQWTPFAGPGGKVDARYETSGSRLHAIPAGHEWIRYRVVMNGTDTQTPVLKSVRLGRVTDNDWAGLDREAPNVTRITPIVFENPMAPVKIRISDETAVDWKNLVVRLDGDDVTSSLVRDGNVLTYTPAAPGFMPDVPVFEKIRCWKTVINLQKRLNIAPLDKDPSVLRVTREDAQIDTAFSIASPDYSVVPGTEVTVSFDLRANFALPDKPKYPLFRLSWFDAERKEIGASVPIPVRNSEDWKRYSVTAKAPAKAAFANVSYGFDNPNIFGGGYLDLRNPAISGKGISPVKTQAWNTHLFTVCASDLAGNAVEKSCQILVDKPITENIVTIRKDGAVLIDGKPFFPIGLYAVWKRDFNHNSFDEAFEGLRKGGFNLAHTYSSARTADFREFMDAAARHGVKLYVASASGANKMNIADYLKDVINERHHPAMLSWYLADDTASHVGADEVKALHDAIHEIDNAHITCQADPVGAPENSRYRAFVNSTDCFLPEIYPVRKGVADETMVPKVIQDMKVIQADLAAHGNPRKTIWPIIQYFQGWGAWTRFPTYEELRAMSFLSIIHGGNGITWYTYGGWGPNHGCCDTPEIWATQCKVATQLHDLADVFLTECYEKAETPAVVSGPAKDALGFDSISVLFKRVGDRQFLICANSAMKEVKATLKAKGGVSKGKVWFEDRSVTLKDGVFTDVFKPYDVHVYELTR